MLEARNITKSFGDFSLGISFIVNDGETLVLSGPSGCGKTTILNIIAGFVEPDGGAVILDGKDITGLPPWKRDMSVVFQDLGLFPHLNAGGNIEFGLKVRKMPRSVRAEAVSAMLSLVNLSGYEKRRVGTLSGGEKQRVALARALAISPRALLLDEPFTGLDIPLRASLAGELARIFEESAVPRILVTHSPEEAELLGDRVIRMESGRALQGAFL